MPAPRNREDLTDQQFTHMWNGLIGAGAIGMTLLTAWIAKERLRDLLATSRTGADRHRIGHLRWKFLTWCAETDILEIRQLAPELPTASGTRPTSSYAHAASPPAETAGTSAPAQL